MQLFPLDENGDVLRRMVENGDNLTLSRDIDFVVVLPDNGAASQFAAAICGLGFKATVSYAGTVPSLPWEVTVVRHMLPTHEGITQFEQSLAREAAAVGGRNDGWGCLQQD